MREECRHEVVALGSELQHPSPVGHDLVHLGHSIDHVCGSLLGVCLGHRKDLALTTAVAASAADLRDRLQRELDARELVTCWLIVLHQPIQIVLPCPVPTAIAPAFLRLG